MEKLKGGIMVIQYNWEENLRKNEKFWAYYKPLNELSEHGNVGEGNFSILSRNRRSLQVKYIANECKILFVCPLVSFAHIHNKSIISLDAGDGGLGISVSTDNKLFVWETDAGLVRRDLEGHLFDVYTCRLFPSGIVGLSGGADMQIKIWDLATGSCPVTMKGHTATVTGMAIIERGKNIITVCKGGSVRLWNCAQAKCLDILMQVESPVTCCDVIDSGGTLDLSEGRRNADELEFGTEGKILACGCDDGKLFFIDIHGRVILASHSLPSSILCLTWLASRHLIVGLEEGQLLITHLSNLNFSPRMLGHDSASGVLSIKPLRDGFVIGRKDGICQVYSVEGRSTAQLTGPDCDPVYAIAVNSEFVFTACRDSVIRKYKIDDIYI